MEPRTLWPFGLWILLVLATLGGMMLISHFLGERRRDPATNVPYESGMLPTGSARLRITPQYYLVAMLFVVFDLEAAFLLTWAVAVRESGWAGVAEVTVFTGVLLIALLWVVRLGVLDWAPTRKGGR